MWALSCTLDDDDDDDVITHISEQQQQEGCGLLWRSLPRLERRRALRLRPLLLERPLHLALSVADVATQQHPHSSRHDGQLVDLPCSEARAGIIQFLVEVEENVEQQG